MANKRPAVADAMAGVGRTTTIYPAEFAGELKGREKRTLGDLFGLTQYGVNLTVLKPGVWSAQRHWHAVEDEFVYVTAGEITLLDEAGEHKMTPGMCAGFKAGVPNGHRLENRTSQDAAYLEIGTRSPTETVTYPDVDMVAIKTDGKFVVTRKDGTAF